MASRLAGAFSGAWAGAAVGWGAAVGLGAAEGCGAAVGWGGEVWRGAVRAWRLVRGIWTSRTETEGK